LLSTSGIGKVVKHLTTHRKIRVSYPEAVFLVVCDPSMNEL
jgi:hypothetical protein